MMNSNKGLNDYGALLDGLQDEAESIARSLEDEVKKIEKEIKILKTKQVSLIGQISWEHEKQKLYKEMIDKIGYVNG